MTQEEADKIFETDLGRQLEVIYVTSDDRVFIRYEEAVLHTNDMMNADPESFVDTSITEWYPSYEPHLNMSTYPNGITKTTKTMKKKILEGNRLIAEFDGRINELCHHNNTSSPYDYDKSWDWLMPIVEKIESIIFNENNSFNVTIGSGNYCVIQDSHGEVYDSVEDYKESKLLTTYSAVVDFIKWYNENKNQ